MESIEQFPVQWSTLQLWFLHQLKERKVKKINDTVNEIELICSEMPILGSSIKAIQLEDVKFNRQGKFRYWFKELHRVSTKPDNSLIVEELWSKVLQYTKGSVTELDHTFSQASKSSFNVSEHFIGLLKRNSFQVNYNPCYSQTTEPDFSDFNLTKSFKVDDFSWSRSCQSTVSFINRRSIRVVNVFLGQIVYETCSPSSLCCLKSSEHEPDLLLTSGRNMKIWDVRKEGPALVSHEIPSPCSSFVKHSSKSSCFVERDEFSCVLAGKDGKLNLLDKRRFSDIVSVVDTRFRDIFSVEVSREGQSLLLQSVNGVVKVFDVRTLETVESGYSAQADVNPISGQSFDGDFFIQCSKKLTLFCELFRLPVLSVQLPFQTKVLSSTFCREPKQIFCSGVSNAFLISFH